MSRYADEEESIVRFADTVPRLLLQHPETAHLSLRLSELGLADALKARFIVAIVGQMRAGKSTLLNALIGRDLAPTGVTETTATVNWFRHGIGELCGKFRVHWVDGSTDDLPLESVHDWVGQAENALRTRGLDFFHASEFLETCNIVDTPGIRSTIASHEAATQGFLAERRADAVVYAINPVAKQTDSDLLHLFGEQTRLPGASAYNSVAVVQKWEHLRPDPLAEVGALCDRLKRQLEGKVAEVLPVSGLLAMNCLVRPDWAWDQIVLLASATPQNVLDDLMTAPAYFKDNLLGAALSREERVAVADEVPWPVLSFAAWVSRHRAFATGSELRKALWQIAGIDRLSALLHERFFSLAGLIKAGSVLRKTWDPCATAMLTLREVRDARSALRTLGQSSLDTLSQAVTSNGELRPVLTYVTGSLQSVEAELRSVERTIEGLDALVYRAERDFRFLEGDVDFLRQLEGCQDELTSDEHCRLRRLFGLDGPEIHVRLGVSQDSAPAEALGVASKQYEYWGQQQRRARGALRRILEHAIERLAMMMDHLEQSTSQTHA